MSIMKVVFLIVRPNMNRILMLYLSVLLHLILTFIPVFKTSTHCTLEKKQAYQKNAIRVVQKEELHGLHFSN
jgi:hypothetical protein